MPKMDLNTHKGEKMQLNPNKNKKMEFKRKERKAKEPTTDFQRAVRRENNRYQNAVSDDYYRIVCFRTFDELVKFFELLEMPEARMVNGYEFQERAKSFAAAPKKIPYKPSDIVPCEVLHDPRNENPPKGEYLNEYIKNDIDIVLNHITGRGVQEGAKYPADSGIYSVLVWANDADREAAVMELGLSKYGFKYLDGVRLLSDWEQ